VIKKEGDPDAIDEENPNHLVDDCEFDARPYGERQGPDDDRKLVSE
jgi:hypothetical protein